MSSFVLIWLHASVPNPACNKTRLTCRWCKRFSYIVINVITTDFTQMCQLVAGPFGNRVLLDNGFVGFPVNRPDSPRTLAENDRRERARQMWPEGSLAIQTRDASRGIFRTRSIQQKYQEYCHSPQNAHMQQGAQFWKIKSRGQSNESVAPKRFCRTRTYLLCPISRTQINASSEGATDSQRQSGFKHEKHQTND